MYALFIRNINHVIHLKYSCNTVQTLIKKKLLVYDMQFNKCSPTYVFKNNFRIIDYMQDCTMACAWMSCQFLVFKRKPKVSIDSFNQVLPCTGCKTDRP